MKQKLIEVNTNKKSIELKFNKKAWHKATASVIIFALTIITIFAIISIIVAPMVMVDNWKISGAPLGILIFGLAWLGLVAIINKK